MYDLIAIGELLIDMTPVESQSGQAFCPNPGGAPCNFLTMAQHMGAKTAFIGKVGRDQFGLRLRDTVEAAGVDTAHLILDSERPTTLAFVHLDASGDRSFSFYRKGCADVGLRTDEVDMGVLERTRALYFGSLAFTDEPIRSTVGEVLNRAKALGLLICYDPNYRPLLWDSEAAAIAAMRGGLVYADVLKVSEEEARLLTGLEDLEAAAKALAKEGIPLVCVTLGAEGTLVCFKEACTQVPALAVKALDTTGAGDAFFGTLMQQLVCSDVPLAEQTLASVRDMVRVANAAAGLCVQAYGAIPAMPAREQVFAAVK